MTRTDALLSAIRTEIEARRGQFDADQPLDCVTLIVRLAPDGQAMDVETRTSGRRTLRRRVAA